MSVYSPQPEADAGPSILSRLSGVWKRYRNAIVDALTSAGEAGAKLLISQLGGDAPKFSLKMLRKAAERRADQLIAELDDTTEKDFRAGRDPFPAKRAEGAAVAETAGAFNGGMSAVAQESPLTEKRWVTQPGACKECNLLASQGWIPIRGEWYGGITGPAIHPFDRCSIEYQKGDQRLSRTNMPSNIPSVRFDLTRKLLAQHWKHGRRRLLPYN